MYIKITMIFFPLFLLWSFMHFLRYSTMMNEGRLGGGVGDFSGGGQRMANGIYARPYWRVSSDSTELDFILFSLEKQTKITFLFFNSIQFNSM